MACAATAASKDANTNTGNAGIVAVSTSSASSSVNGAVGGVATSSTCAGASGVSGTILAATSTQTGITVLGSGSGAMNRQARFATEGVGARVVRGPDWKWGKQTYGPPINGLITFYMRPRFLTQQLENGMFSRSLDLLYNQFAL
uniref:MIB/HERC2 domain-containing protein n=1 Tax=Glossina brevipalpis TaxID=37001 RepID=A0A1A9WDI2_9MUSC